MLTEGVFQKRQVFEVKMHHPLLTAFWDDLNQLSDGTKRAVCERVDCPKSKSYVAFKIKAVQFLHR